MSACPVIVTKPMEEQIKDAILRILDSPVPDHPLSEVIEGASGELDASKAAIKSAIWELYADGLVELTPDWDLRRTRTRQVAATV